MVFESLSGHPRKSPSLTPRDEIADGFAIGGTVGVSEILAEIDREIAQLQQARALLVGAVAQTSKKAGSNATGKPRKKKRNLTPEGRRRIAEAVKRRWAEQKKAAAAK